MRKSLFIIFLFSCSLFSYAQDNSREQSLALVNEYAKILTQVKDSSSTRKQANEAKHKFLKIYNPSGVYNFNDVSPNSGKPFLSAKSYVHSFDKSFPKGTVVSLNTQRAFTSSPILDKARNAYIIKVNVEKTTEFTDENGMPQKQSISLEFYIRQQKEDGKSATKYMIEAVTKRGVKAKYRPLSKLQKWWIALDDDWKGIIRKELKLGETPTDYYLKRVIGIKRLDLSNSHITNFKPVLALRGLLELNLSKSKIRDLNYLKNCSRLKKLDLSESNLTTLSGLEHNLHLEILDVSKNELTDLEPLEGLKNLLELDFSNNQVEDLNPLALCTKMKELRFNLNIVKDLKPIQNLAYLEKLHFSKNQDIETLAPLSKMTRLVELDCFNSKVSTLTPIRHLTKITYLDIGYTNITSLNVFSHLKYLTYLSFTGNKIEDFSVLYKFPYLKYLDCSTTKISDIAPINKMQGLLTFKANNTDFTKEDIQKFKKKHPNCKKIYYWK
ncbi:MAG: leucine-rich repeat domain-containing protein [Cytophagales bacterium]|nr:leucine-rich repeat domain-containing protein [Cytophagales bacterium]